MLRSLQEISGEELKVLLERHVGFGEACVLL